MLCLIVGAAVLLGGTALIWRVSNQSRYQQCAFDRNELGPKGEHGQWWYDVYKCPDGTERRVLVAGPRG